MSDKLIKFETAQLAKEVGFDLDVQCAFVDLSPLEEFDKEGESVQYFYKGNHNKKEYRFSAPTQSLLQKWLREEKKLSVIVKHYPSGTFTFEIQQHNGDATGWSKLTGFMESSFYKYEQSLEQGIVKALEKIISK